MSETGIQWLSDIKTEIVLAIIGPSETNTAGEELTCCSHQNVNVGDESFDVSKMWEISTYSKHVPDIQV